MLGLVAWILPLVHMRRIKKNANGGLLAIISMSACAISLCLQIFYQYHLVEIEDWSALMDTTGAVAFASAVLLIGTLFLNGLTLVVNRNKAK